MGAEQDGGPLPVPEDEGASYGLVMPFIVTTGNGGPYDSEAFVAGARWGQDYAEAKGWFETEWATTDPWQQYVYPAMVPQYDLLAMHFGVAMTAVPWDEHPDEWVLVTFTRKASEDGR